MEGKSKRTNWSAAPTIIVVEPVCPYCGEVKRNRSRTDDNGDGSRTQFFHCRDCGKPFMIAIEPQTPGSGLLTIWPE